MESEVIRKKLEARFAAPLPDFYKRRIIFWHDEDQSFGEMIDEFDFPGVKILKLTGSNNFYAKMLLSEEDTASNYLVYNPITYNDIRDNWLLDIECYSEEFRADLLSMRMDELGLSSSASLRKAMKLYSRFFDNQGRVAKLKALGSTYNSAGQLHVDVLTVLSGAAQNNPASIIRAVLMAGLDNEDNAALTAINKFGDAGALWELVQKYTGYEHKEGSKLSALAAHLLLTALSVTCRDSFFAGLESFVSVSNQANCYALVNEWLHSDDDSNLYDICREVEEMGALRKRFDKLEVADMLSSEIFPCINECILGKFLAEISENVIKADDIFAAVEKRRTLKWYKRIQHYYDGVLSVANMQKFYQEHITGFHIARYQDMWKKYQEEYYLMDTYYRQFYTAFNETLVNSNSHLQDAFQCAADYVEKLYKNWYLQELSSKWTDLIRDDLAESSSLKMITQQRSFYTHHVSSLLSGGGRVFVIVSDALRYEVAAELNEALLRETKGKATLSAMQSVLPSVTKYGMAALLPHRSYELAEDGKVYCDGLSTEGTANREKILQAREKASAATTYKTLLGLKQAEKRDLIAGKNVVYIYHNSIDITGEAMVTEDKVFDACMTAIEELKNLVRVITNELNGTNILITSDHGFLYSHGQLKVRDKAEKDYVSGVLLETDRRYIIAGKGSKGQHLLEIPLREYHCDYMLMVPQDNIRFKAGGGMNYVHGGVSLQEMMVPVITFKNMRTTSKNFVEASKVKLELISSGRKVSNSVFSLNFYQKEAVGGKVGACVYSVFFTDAAGRPISDVKTIISDKTTDNGSDRVFRETFTLKSQEYKKTEEYYLNIVEKDSSDIPERIAFSIDISFVDDFDLVFGEDKNETLVQVKIPAGKVTFKDTIYTFDEAKELYLKVYPEETFNGSALSDKVKQALEEQGYSVDNSFAVKGFMHATEYFIAEFDKQDILDVTPYIERFGQAIVGSALKVLRDRTEIIEFEPNQYINVRKLNALGIRKKQLREYCDQVFEFGQRNKYFTVKSLLSSGIKADIDDLGFGEVFYEALITEDSRFARTTLGKTLVFSAQTDKITAVDFIVDYVTGASFIEVDMLLNDLNKRFGIELNRQGLFVRIKDTALYYDKVLDYLYKDYDAYYKDI